MYELNFESFDKIPYQIKSIESETMKSNTEIKQLFVNIV